MTNPRTNNQRYNYTASTAKLSASSTDLENPKFINEKTKMGKRKNSPNKDDKSWIEPETKKVKTTTAKCAQIRGNTEKLVKQHENYIKSESNACKMSKVKCVVNNKYSLQKYVAKSADM